MNKDIIQNLKDADCDTDFIQKFQAADVKEQISLLNRYRTKLLNNLHLCQRKLDCLDYLIFNLEQTKDV